MDKLRVALAVARKHHFWVLCAVVLAVGLGIWWTATNSLAERYGNRTNMLTGKFDNLQQVCGLPNHPNPGVIDAIDLAIGGLKRQVLRSWELLYTKQKQLNPVPALLDEEFVRAFEALTPPDDELADEHLETYQNFIGDHLPKLFEIVDYVRPKNAEAAPEPTGGSRSPAPPSQTETIGTVVWDEQDRDRLGKRFFWTKRPSTLQVRLAQEDLWVYEAMVRIIKNTNEGATENFNAPVKQIQALEIAQEAVASLQKAKGKVVNLGAVVAAGAGAGAGTPPDPSSLAPRQPGEETAPGDKSLLDGRYVDADGRPLSVEPTDRPFKIMPICMKLVMDQRKIPRLLVHCANSSMPIEVRRLRLWPGEGGSALNLAQLAGETRAAGGGAAPQFAAAREGGAGALPARLRGFEDVEAGKFDLPVEIHGFIYVYNPPDLEMLGAEAAAEQPPAESGQTPPETPPAGTPPAGPAPVGPAPVGPAPTDGG